MNTPYAIAATLMLAAALPSFQAAATEAIPEIPVEVKKSSFKGAWPFAPTRAQLTCRPSGYANTVVLPDGRYALNARARAEGFVELKASTSLLRGQADADARLERFVRAAEAVCARQWRARL